jgi:amidophosphoribosyltransferase
VFDGRYVTKDIDDEYLHRLDEARSDSAKTAQTQKLEQSNNAMIGIHNDG